MGKFKKVIPFHKRGDLPQSGKDKLVKKGSLTAAVNRAVASKKAKDFLATEKAKRILPKKDMSTAEVFAKMRKIIKELDE